MIIIRLVLVGLILLLIGCSTSTERNRLVYQPIIIKTDTEYKIKYSIILNKELSSETNSIIYKVKQSESLFYPIRIRFVLSQIIYLDDQCHDNESLDVLNIYYGSFNGFVAGYSGFPEENNSFISIYGDQTPDVFAHEIGHWLTLRHTFGEDYVDDTPEVHDINSWNIMDYSVLDWYWKGFSPGQIDRLRIALEIQRSRCILK